MDTNVKNDLNDILALRTKLSQIPDAIANLGATGLTPVIYKAINLLTIQKGLSLSDQSAGQGAWIF